MTKDKYDIAIKVSRLTKTFKIPLESHSGIKQKVINHIKGYKGYREFTPLKDISFDIKKGEFFGIVGRNGSGKSTLLKSIAGIYTPDSGGVVINGTLVPFIELGVGFNPELTGRENVFLNGALLGFSRSEMEVMYDEIVDFAELHDFMEERLKNYSSGMQVRLAFSIAIRARGDILLLDEVLAVGDAAFQRKCTDYFEDMKNSDKTIILVTHSMADVEKYCDRALMLESGSIKVIGEPSKIAKQYTLDNLNSEKQAKPKKNNLSDSVKELTIELKSPKIVTSEDVLKFDVSYRMNSSAAVDLGISVLSQGISLIEHNTKELALNQDSDRGHTLSYSLPLKNLNSGRYELTAAIFEKNQFKLIGYTDRTNHFIIKNDTKQGGILMGRGEWSIKS